MIQKEFTTETQTSPSYSSPQRELGSRATAGALGSCFRGCQEILRTDNSLSPRKRGPRGKRLKSLGSRFRGNDEQRAQRWDMRNWITASFAGTTNNLMLIRSALQVVV